MFPILYEGLTSYQVPENNGLGILSDCSSCICEEARNGIYELTFEYPISGIHASEIAYLRVVKQKPNPTDDPQLFYIDRIGKTMNGLFTVYCKHISYLISGFEITSGQASTAVLACALLQSAVTGYTITTDKDVTANFKITEPSSVRSWFGGKEGSMLDVFGTGEWKYNNFDCKLWEHRGQDRGVTISYGKNLLELSQEIDATNLYTHVLCYYKSEDTVVYGSKVATGITLDVPKCRVVDCSGDYIDPPTVEQLTARATSYVNNNNLTTPKNNITLDYVQSGELTDRVDLCDTVSVYYEALGITRTSVKCIRTKYDCIREKYIETEFGDARTNLADTIVETNNAIAEKPSKSYLAEAVDKATKLITGNLGGYVVIHDSNGDGEPDEILIMNTPDISTATKIWRWNQQGLGYATSYAGPYGLAMTSDGSIVADFVTAGSMSGNRVRTGLISSTNNLLQIDLDNGIIVAPAITLQGQDVGTTLDSLVQTSVETRYALSNSGTVIPSAFPLTQPTTPTEQQPYLWSRTIYTYANNQTSTSYGVSVRGNDGQDGQDGRDIEILGSYDTMADLIAAHPTGEVGEVYLVGGDLVVWNDDTSSWKDVGRIQGPSGFDGLWLAIENNDDGTSSNVTYTVKLLKGVTDVTATYDAVFVWQLVKESGITEIATNTATITVTRDSADYGATIRCICIAILTEEVMQDYAYNTIQDYSGNDIQIIGSNVVKLIGENEIYKPYAISTQFQVLSDEISSKVSQTDFNSLSGTVTTQGTQIQQNAQAILLKADTSTVNTQMNGKMGTDMSNRASSILIDSGQIRFDSNSLIVNSNQFTLDASGNAVFAGNLTAATLLIDGSAVGIGTAINNAEAGAISTAAIDATNKANNAKDAAFDYTDTGLATKVGNSEARTKFAADTHSIEIQSGTVKFKSNTLLIDSTQFTLDASGNAVFKGNLSAATLVIGGSATNIGTAINNAQSNAIATSESYAESYANGVASTAQSNAVTASKSYTDGQISTVNQSLTVMNGQIAGKVSQTDFNTLSNTVSTQETAIEQNAQAITLKADTSTVNSQLSGKMATDMSNRSSSITINSGEIKFQSNTVSIDATNLSVTKAGLVTAKKFTAKDEFNLQDASGNKRGYFKYPSTGTHFAILDSSELEIGEMWDTTNGARFRLKDGSHTTTVAIDGATGDITSYTGKVWAHNFGTICIRNTNDDERVALFKGGNDDGVLSLYDTSGDVRTQLVGKDGVGYFNDSSGTHNVTITGDTGIIECVRVRQSSSRKVKENIKPIEDSNKILELQAVSFDYKDKKKGTDMRGFIAEDVAEILPNLVTPETEETTASLDYVSMIPYLQDIIKKQQKQIDYLMAEVEKLKGDK